MCGPSTSIRPVCRRGNAELALVDWLDVCDEEARSLFWGLGNRNRYGQLSGQAVYSMLSKRAKVTGVSPLSPHPFLSTFVSDLLDAGAGIVMVQKMGDHNGPTTPSRYDRHG